jgi:hypothetical protein
VPIFIGRGAPLQNTLQAPISADFRTSRDAMLPPFFRAIAAV